MAVEPDKRGQEIEYSSFGVFQANDTPTSTATHSLASTVSIQSPSAATGYSLFRKTPRPISSIEQFDFKSSPETINNNNDNQVTTNNVKPTLPSSSGFTTMSSYTADTSTALLKQPSFDMNDEAISNKLNTFALQSLPTTTTATTAQPIDDVAGSNNSGKNTPPKEQPQQQQQKQQLNELHEQLMTYKEDQDIAPTLQQKRQRNYQNFPGNSTFFCGGRLMTSQAHWAFIIALLLVIVPSVLFGVFTCPFLWSNIHPVVPVFYAYLFVIAVVSMLKTSWTDPGVIPRGLDPIPTLESFDDHSSIWTQPFPADRCVKIKDEMWNLKYCSTCKIYRPPRASHCRQCDNCVENEDHHCIWLNNCIGKRNYRPFFTFIMTCSLMAIYLIVFTVLHLILGARQIQPDINFDLVFQTAPVSFVLAIVGFFLLWMVGGLTTYHCHLVWKGVTTHEKLRTTLMDAQIPRHPNPYGKTNPLKNIMQVLCRPQPKSHLRRRKYADSP